jgi:hypothetical protein
MGEHKDKVVVMPEEKKYLTADDILNAQDIAYNDLFIPAWNGSVRVKSLTVDEKDEAMKMAMMGDRVDSKLFRIALVVVGCVEPKFTAKQALELGKKNGAVVYQIAEEVSTMSAMSQEMFNELKKKLSSLTNV